MRLFVFGWDGADWEVIRAGWDHGRLPVLRSVCAGASGPLRSTIPPVTPCAWTSFLTGVEPGEHGIFGFRTVDPETYRLLPVPGGARRVPTLIEGLDRAGYRTALVTVPWTYPAEELMKGAIVPGWDAPDETLEHVHPAELRADLAEVVSRVPQRSPERADPAAYVARQRENVALREVIAATVFERVQPDVFALVFTEPDQASHRLWTTPEVPEALVDAYEVVDEAMGRLLDRFAEGGDLIAVVSDHGSRPLHAFVHMAYLLNEGGWLRVASEGPAKIRAARAMKRQVWYRMPPAARLFVLRHISSGASKKVSRQLRRTQIDWPNTRAFPIGNEAAGIGLHVNTSPPFRSGPVDPSDYEDVRQELTEFLLAVIDPETDRPVFRTAAAREHIYHGPFVDQAPDLVLVPEEGYGTRSGLDLSAAISRVAVGGHRQEGIYAASRALDLGPDPSIEAFLPALLSAAGFEPEMPKEQREVATYASDDEAEIEERLRSLGYIE